MKVAQEEDRVPTGHIVAALIATIVLTVVCVVWVRLELSATRVQTLPGPPLPERSLYNEGAGYAAPLIDAKKLELGTWGWVDRPSGTVRLPIDVAMQLVVEESRRQ